jgi:hypothetical protein
MAESSAALRHLYRQLLRSCQSYPSKNRWGIYNAIRDEFRENIELDPSDSETKKKVAVAIKGLSQLRQYDQQVLADGQRQNPHWNVRLEQSPMPKPPDSEDEKR